MEHYRCVKCYLPTTSRERDVDTLQFFPKKIPFPKTSTEDYLKQAASDILAILQKPPTTLPYLACGDATSNAIVAIATLSGRADVPPQLQRAQIPVHPPRVQIPVHPPRVQIPIVHPPRVPLVVHDQAASSAPTTSIPPPTVQTFPTSLSTPKPVPPRVHKLHLLSRLQQRRNFSANRREEKLQLLQANKFFQPVINRVNIADTRR
jgi:hypothetical protein